MDTSAVGRTAFGLDPLRQNIQQDRLATAIASIKYGDMVKMNFTQTYCRKDSEWI